MNAKLEDVIRGWGGAWAPSGEGVRGSSGDPGGLSTEPDAGAYVGMSAKEAVDSLDPEGMAVKPPDIEGMTLPGPVSAEFYLSRAAVAGIQGPVGSGKTTTLLMSRMLRAQEMPRSVIDGRRRYKLLVVRQTYRDLWSTSIPSYLKVFPKDMGVWSGGRGDPVTHVISFEDEYGVFEFTAEFKAFGDDIEGSMRGIEVTDIWLNEADTVPEDVITTGMGRISRYPDKKHFQGLPRAAQPRGQIVCDFNAPDEENWTYKIFHDTDRREKASRVLTKALEGEEWKRAKDEGRDPEPVPPVEFAFFNQPGYGEPGCENLENLVPGYYETQIELNKLAGRGDKNDRLIFNKVGYIRVGEPVFKREFSPRVHVSDEPLELIPDLPLLIGLDQGFKGAAVIAQCAGFFRWRILGELHFPQERLMATVFGQRLADLIGERWPNARVECGYGDMAGEHGASQAADENMTWNLLVGRTAGFHVRPQVIGTNRLQPRLEAIRAALEAPLEAGAPGLLIDPSCRYLRRGFSARYVWRDEVDRSGDKRKIPDKSFTEANVMDGLQYLLLSGHLADGTSPYAHRDPVRDRRNSHFGMGHNGGPPMPDAGGLKSGWDILDPYARRA